MKHPSLRCTDILFLDPQVRDQIYDYVRASRELLHPFIRDNMVEFQHVGSMTFGNNALRSDWDFNIAMKDWNDQVKARRIYYGNIGGWRAAYEDHFMKIYRKCGLKVDVGCVDADTDNYNIHVSLRDMVLHHRFSTLPEGFRQDEHGEVQWSVPDEYPIDLLTFDPVTDRVPPVANQHLRWNHMAHRWQRIILDNGQPGHIVAYLDKRQGAARWAEDKWADEVPKWQAYYGERFQTYRLEGNTLIQV